jgi:signal transduction histidine kinase/CheY-like chemotaxis protein
MSMALRYIVLILFCIPVISSAEETSFDLIDKHIQELAYNINDSNGVSDMVIDSLFRECSKLAYTPGIAALHKIKGIRYFNNSILNKAYEHYLSSLELSLAIEDSLTITQVSNNIIEYYIIEHRYDDAIQALQRIDKYQPANVGQKLEMDIKWKRAILQIELENFDEALSILNDSLFLASITLENRETDIQLLKAKVFLKTEDYNTAFIILKQIENLYSETDGNWVAAQTNMMLADIFFMWDDYQEAVSYYSKALDYMAGSNDLLEMEVYQRIAHALIHAKEFNAAKEYLHKAISMADTFGSKYAEANIAMLNGELAYNNDNYLKAEFEFHEAKQMFQQLNVKYELFMTHVGLVYLAIKTNNFTEVKTSIEFLKQNIYSYSSKPLQVYALRALVKYYKISGGQNYVYYLELLTDLQNQINCYDKYKNFLNAQSQYVAQSTSDELKEKQKELTEIKADFKVQQWIIILMVFASLVFLIFLIIIIRFYNENKKSTTQLIHKNQEIIRSKEALLKAKEKAEESDRLKSSFLANMSHEIRTPMNSIIGFTNLLSQEDLTIDKRSKYRKIVERNGRNLVDLIDDIIDLSKIESKQLEIKNETCDLHDVLLQLKKFYSKEIDREGKEELELRLIIPTNKSVKSFLLDVFRLKQVLSNLLSNAVKFTERGVIEFGYSVNENNVKFFVQDTGIGISDEYKELVFKRFRQVDESVNREYGGTGLGLTLSKALVELMKGNIWFNSDVNKGTIFYVSLPLMRPVFSEDIEFDLLSEQDEKAIINWNQHSVLVAEDEDDNFMLIEEILEPTQIKVFRAKNGKEAVDMVKKQSEIKVVLMDIKMPVMDGYEATMYIKDYSTSVKVIAQTAFALSDDQSKGFNAGCDGFISKPIKSEELISELKRFLD